MSDTNVNMQVQAFENPEFGEIRSVLIDNEPWLVGKDVAEALGYTNSRKAISDHVDGEDKIDEVTIRDPIGRCQNPILINESGLYSLILSSKLPNAKKFKRWVTSEVLPAIRKTGVYQTPGSGPRMTDAEISEMIRDMPPEKLPVYFEFLQMNGYTVPDYSCSPAALTAANYNAQTSTVQAFANEILPQSQWDLLPFGALYDLYTKWHERNQIPGNLLGKTHLSARLQVWRIRANSPAGDALDAVIPSDRSSL